MMQRTPIEAKLSDFPADFHRFLRDARLYDSSCSKQATVYYIEKSEGFFLKTAPRGTLRNEAELTAQYHKLGFATEVLNYFSEEKDWLLTKSVPGEDCLHPQYLDDPKRLSALMGQLLRRLHETDAGGLSVRDHTAQYAATARRNYDAGNSDAGLFPDNWGYRSPEEAWAIVERISPLLKSDTLLHGDYCLPNIILSDWQFSGFIDLDSAGLGDRHIDLFWGIWSLDFNLKTDVWTDRFLDAYGRDRIDNEILSSIGAFEVFA